MGMSWDSWLGIAGEIEVIGSIVGVMKMVWQELAGCVMHVL